jgi:hypothetical protein
VDSPWEVCLLKMMVEVSGHSYPGNVRELERHNLFADSNGMSQGLRQDIEADFQAANRNPALISGLGRKLQQKGIFAEYEDRFFALVKTHRAKKP